MTEAQKCLYHIAENMRMDKSISKEGYEYFQQAIKALEQEPYEDCVSREQLNKLYNEYRPSLATRVCEFGEKLKELPPVKPATVWHRVEDELPKKDGEYLLYGRVIEDEDYYIFIGEYDTCGEQFGYWEQLFDATSLGCLGGEFYEYDKVYAWMPLPKWEE